MPGSQRNSWSSYLNGGTAQYNFSYKDGEPIQSEMSAQPATPVPQSPSNKNNVKQPPPVNTTPQPISEPINKNKKQTGGKRKSHRRSHKKYRRTHRK
jgi:hypothetical protein